MKRLRSRFNVYGFLLCLLFLGCWFVVTEGQDDDDDTNITVTATMEKKEQEALYSAIQGLIGKQWNGSDLYPDPCGWTPIQGVSCDIFNGYWYITSMNIGPVLDNSLKCSHDAKLTHHLFKLKHLKSLSFYNCFLSPTRNPTTIPTSEWEALSGTLESLEFRSNRGLVGIIPSAIGSSLKELQSLVLIDNGLTGWLPVEMSNLVKLKRLVLAGNMFTGPIPDGYGGLNRLLIFDASRNFLSGPLPRSFGGLVSLLKLDLGNNMLQGNLPEEIGGMKNLTLFDLRGNNISGGLIHSIQELVSIKEIVISNNPIGGDLVGILWERLQELEILDLSNITLIGKIPEDSILELKRLRFLGLSDNHLSGNISPRLAEMPNIGALYLHGNNFSGALELPERFYARMGRRFGAWNNPNLCYRVESPSTAIRSLYGVKPCQEETTTISKFSEGTDHNLDKNQHSFEVPLSSSNTAIDGFWGAPKLVQGLVSFLICNVLS